MERLSYLKAAEGSATWAWPEPARRTRGRVHAHVRQANIATVQTRGGGIRAAPFNPVAQNRSVRLVCLPDFIVSGCSWAVCPKLLTLPLQIMPLASMLSF